MTVATPSTTSLRKLSNVNSPHQIALAPVVPTKLKGESRRVSDQKRHSTALSYQSDYASNQPQNEYISIEKNTMIKLPHGSQYDLHDGATQIKHSRSINDFAKLSQNVSPSKKIKNIAEIHKSNENVTKKAKSDINHQKSPKSKKKITQVSSDRKASISTSNSPFKAFKSPYTSPSTPLKQKNKQSEHRHGSFSSPFKMPKFTSKEQDHSKTSDSSSYNKPSEAKTDSNLISTATSALRRLHFKSGRNATKTTSRVTTFGPNDQIVPKVIVMGSSSTSETTINTSTDSANTIITTMTNTDGYVTEDSLEKLDSDEVLITTITKSPSTCNLIDFTTSRCQSPKDFNTKLADDDEICSDCSQRNCTNCTKSAIEDTFDKLFLYTCDDSNPDAPKTAFHEKKFIFSSPVQSPKLNEAKTPKLGSKAATKFTFPEFLQHTTTYKAGEAKSLKSIYNSDFNTITTVVEEKTRFHRPNLSRRQSEQLSSTYQSDEKSEQDKGKSRNPSRRRRQSSPKNEFKSDSYKVKRASFKGPRRNLDDLQSRNSQLPDLRVDFCGTDNGAESSENANLYTERPAASPVCLNQCLRNVGATLECALSPCGSLTSHHIHVTTNPLDSSTVHQHSASLNRSIPQATIVVQQPSLSLDSGTSQVSTLLLKNGSEFIANMNCTASATTSGNQKTKRQRDETMKHFLDVTNNFTVEELHDFEMRYGSPHHSRSQSVKTPGRSSSGRPNYLCLPQQRSRVASMPNTGVEEEYYRLRHFSITGKGVVNRGDSLQSRRSRSNNSVASSNSSTEHLITQIGGAASYPGSARTSVSSRESSNASHPETALLVLPTPGIHRYRVVMVGSDGVGKSSLVSQFMTSEYLHAYDTSIDEESGEKSVSVLLAGEESDLTFIDLPHAEVSPENEISAYNVGDEPHAYCVVFSCSDRRSLDLAEWALATLWTNGSVASKAIILVANKCDLVRSRVITTEEGKVIATQYDCKYIETSVTINHNVDELLVGILSQIRLKLEDPEGVRDFFRKRSCKKNRSKSPIRMGNPITTALTSCSGVVPNNNGDSEVPGPSNQCWLTTDSPDKRQVRSAQSSPKKKRNTRTSASLKVKNFFGKVWDRDTKSKSCENLHVL